MEIQVIFPNQPDVPQSLQVLKKIGQGKFKIYQAYCPSEGINYALKAFPTDTHGSTQYQKETLLFGLSHPNIIKHIPATFVPAVDTSYHAILTEFAQYGEFFELVTAGFFDREVLIRTYFHQLIAGMEYIHSQGIAHLDLKLENLMMGSDFNLKIIDFDHAQKIQDKKLTSSGTIGFRAPEVIDKRCINLLAADVYSAGVILFAFRAREYPFLDTKNEKGNLLKYYSKFMKDNQLFWEMKAMKKQDNDFFSESFKDLVNGMLEYDVSKRFTIQNIKQSKWYNGPVLDTESLQAEMKTRLEVFMKV